MHNTKMIDGQLHCLHRFIVTEKGELGITLETHQSTARLREVSKNSLAEYFGMRKNDIIVSERPLELPEDVNMYYDEINTGERPTVIEVWRATTSESNRTLTSINIQVDRDNPFLIEFPKMINAGADITIILCWGRNVKLIDANKIFDVFNSKQKINFMSLIIVILAVATAAFVAFSLRKKSSHDEAKTSGPVNPIVVENAIPEPVVLEPVASTPVVEEPVATPEQKVTRKTNAAKQSAAKKTATKTPTKRTR
jgi:hypothetical protein